jgi:hypothetical protein
MVLPILGKSLKIENLSTGKRSMYIDISGWHTFCFGCFTSLTDSRWHRWCSGPTWHWSWWRCTRGFASPACLWIHCRAILGKKSAGRLILTNHCQVPLQCNLQIVMPGKQNTSPQLCSDFGKRFLNWLMHFLYSGLQKPFFGHFGHIAGKTHVGLFKVYPTSLFCHSSCHVENVQDISCCF